MGLFLRRIQPRKNRKRTLTTSGFTLVEMIVTLAIILISAAVVLFNHARFVTSITLNDLAYEMALSVREAQAYGISVRGAETAVTNPFSKPFGIHFSDTSNSSYIFFSDDNDNMRYQPSDGTVRTLSLRRGNIISDVCAVRPGGTEDCFSSDDIDDLDILFFRPDPDAIINSDTLSSPTGAYESAYIEIQSPQGETKRVVVNLTGQISVQ